MAAVESGFYAKYYTDVPQITRKKPVAGRRQVDSYRVLMEPELTKTPAVSRQERTPHDISSTLPKSELPFSQQTQAYSGLTTDNFLNNPQPRKISYLRQNFRFYNDPVAKVSCDKYSGDEENKWWKWDRVQAAPQKSAYTLDSTFRADFTTVSQGRRSEGAGRFTSNPNIEAAQGIVPVTSVRPKGPIMLKEKQSFAHGYDCRSTDNYPVVGKRQGAFVWDTSAPLPSPYKEQYSEIAGRPTDNTIASS